MRGAEQAPAQISGNATQYTQDPPKDILGESTE